METRDLEKEREQIRQRVEAIPGLKTLKERKSAYFAKEKEAMDRSRQEQAARAGTIIAPANVRPTGMGGNVSDDSRTPQPFTTIPKTVAPATETAQAVIPSATVAPEDRGGPMDISAFQRGHMFTGEDLGRLGIASGESESGTYSDANRAAIAANRDAYGRQLDKNLDYFNRRDMSDTAQRLEGEAVRNASMRNMALQRQLDTGTGWFGSIEPQVVPRAKGRRGYAAAEGVSAIPGMETFTTAADNLRQQEVERQKQDLQMEQFLTGLGLGKAQIGKYMSEIGEINKRVSAMPSSWDEKLSGDERLAKAQKPDTSNTTLLGAIIPEMIKAHTARLNSIDITPEERAESMQFINDIYKRFGDKGGTAQDAAKIPTIEEFAQANPGIPQEKLPAAYDYYKRQKGL